ATAIQNAPLTVFFDPAQKLQPLVFSAHAAQPLASAGECVVAHDALHTMVNGGNVDRVCAAGAARTEETNASRVHFRTGFEISDRVTDVLCLKLRQDQTLLAFTVTKSAVIKNQYGISGFGEAAVIALVQFGVHQSQPTGTLHDAAPLPGSGFIRQLENSFHLRSFAVEGALFMPHGRYSLENLGEIIRQHRVEAHVGDDELFVFGVQSHSSRFLDLALRSADEPARR